MAEPPTMAPLPAEIGENLLDATLTLASTFDLPKILQEFVQRACHLTGAKYGALSVLDNRGETSAFVQHGMDGFTASHIGSPPVGRGVIGKIPSDGALIINNLPADPTFTGFPPGHPKMECFLGVPVQMHEQVFGRLYLCDRPNGFDDSHIRIVQALAAAAAVAVENSTLYAQSRARERWIQVSQRLTTMMLSGTDEEEALETIAKEVRKVAEADTAIIVLPSVGESWAAEIVDGQHTEGLIGMVFPPHGRAMTVLHEGVGMIVDSMERATTLRLPKLGVFGPALYAPLLSRDSAAGVLILFRLPGKPEFKFSDLTLAEAVASQAALALELASARHSEDRAALLEERERIGRDLHDLAIQQLFATGMNLDSARAKILNHNNDLQNLVSVLDSALASVDDSVRQIREIVHDLRDPSTSKVLVERLRREASLARTGLGFAPSMVVSFGDVAVDSQADPEGSKTDLIDQIVGPDLSDDVVAVVREGLANVARHAHASSVQVSVAVFSHPSRRIEITISDDGRGIDPQSGRRSGLSNLAARARQYRGSFTHSNRGQYDGGGTGETGTILKWVAPIA